MRFLIARVRDALPANKFVRGASILVGGSLSVQILGLLAAPLLTRLYTPQEFGALAMFVAPLSIIVVISSLRYQIAIPLPDSKRSAAELTTLCLAIILLVSLITLLIIYFFETQIAELYRSAGVAAFYWLLPGVILLNGCYEVFNFWQVRNKGYVLIAKTRFFQGLSSILIQLSCFSYGAYGLLIGYCIGKIVGTFSLGKAVLTKPEFRHCSGVGAVRQAVRYRKFPLFSTWSGLFFITGSELPVLLYAVYFNATSAGWYALALRVLGLPMTVLGAAISKVFLTSAADANRDGTLNVLVENVHSTLAKIAMPAMLAIAIIGPDLFAFVFGDAWRTAGELAQYMTPWLYISFIASPLTFIFTILEKLKHEVVFHAVLLLVRIAAVLVGLILESLVTAVLLYSLASAMCYVGLLLWIASMTKCRISYFIKPTINSICWSALLTVPLWVSLWQTSGSLTWFISLFATAVLTGLRYFYLFRQSYKTSDDVAAI